VATKGNNYDGQMVNAEFLYETIWMEARGVNGDIQKMIATFRKFVLKNMTDNQESRKPYIFYNTWN